MARKPKYWPLVTLACIGLLLGIAGLVFDDPGAETDRGYPIGYAYAVIVIASLGLLGVAASAWAKRR